MNFNLTDVVLPSSSIFKLSFSSGGVKYSSELLSFGSSFSSESPSLLYLTLDFFEFGYKNKLKSDKSKTILKSSKFDIYQLDHEEIFISCIMVKVLDNKCIVNQSFNPSLISIIIKLCSLCTIIENFL